MNFTQKMEEGLMVFTMDEAFDAVARMKVIGVGGAGGNAVNRMIDSGLSGVEFIAVNTDAMALDNNRATNRLQIGERITKGLGAGANPEVGRLAMEEDRDKITSMLDGTDMLFITGGMGGGTGTGGAPVVAEIARDLDILTVAIVTRPFLFEGKVRDRNARKGIDELRKSVDTIIIIPNQKLLSIVERQTSLIDAFKSADDVLFQATKGISDLISVHGLVNLDFADVKTIMKGMGDALMGTGFAEGDNRAVMAADSAIHSPLLDDVSITGARGILINITGGEDMTLYDVSDATQAVYDSVGEDNETNVIFGAVTDPSMNGKIRVTVIATGFNDQLMEKQKEEYAQKVLVKLPVSKKTDEKKVEQMSMPFSSSADDTENVQTDTEEQTDEDEKVVQQITEEDTIKDALSAITQSESLLKNKSVNRSAIDEALVSDSSEIGMPTFIKKNQVRKERVYVSKGSVITQYEDDMDVPTFLRKQMQ
jgi:cell division protein FtsZ